MAVVWLAVMPALAPARAAAQTPEETPAETPAGGEAVPSAAEILAGAARAEAEGRILDAEREYRMALSVGGLALAETARAHLRLGVLRAASSGDAAAASRDFALALAIDPHLAPPDELPPPERARFEALRGAGYTIAARQEDGVLYLALHGEPALPAHFTVRPDDAPTAEPIHGRAGPTGWTPPPGTRAVTVQALDASGNVVCEHTVALEPPSLAVRREAIGESDHAAARCPAVRGDPCAGPPACRPASCGGGGDDGLAIALGVIGAALAAAAIVVTAILLVDAEAAARWRIDRVEER